MKVRPTEVEGVHVIEPEPFLDERGLFARTWDPAVMSAHGLDPHVAQSSTSWSRLAGTLRGLHYQAAPYEEAKLVRCTQGAVFDVAVDLRPESPTRMVWVGMELTADNRRALYIPRGCAHGFITLTDGAEVFYQISADYQPEAARGYAWDEPVFDIRWPREPVAMSERDRSWPAYVAESATE